MVTPLLRWATAVPRAHMAALAVLLLLVPMAVAWAHARLLRALPASGAQVRTPPSELRLTFSEAPALAFSEVRLAGPSGTAVDLARLTLASESARTIVAAVRGHMTAGVYTVRWQVAGEDGHPIRGQYAFTLTGAAQRSEPHHDPVTFPSGVQNTQGAQGFSGESAGYGVLRGLQFTATLTILGALCFVWWLVATIPPYGTVPPMFVITSMVRGARLGARVAAVLALIAVLRLGAQLYALHGGAGLTDLALWQGVLLQTRWGLGWIMQLLGIGMATWGFGLIGGGRIQPNRRRRDVALIGGVVLALALALSGHAAAIPSMLVFAVLSDTLHVLAAGAWLGSLFLVLTVGVRTARQEAEDAWPHAVAELVRRLHPIALGAVGLLTVTGLYAAWLHVGSLPLLWQSSYGRLLALKLVLVGLAVALGGYNAQRVRPHLVDAPVARRFQRAARAELASGILVLLITAILVATPTAIDAGALPMP